MSSRNAARSTPPPAAGGRRRDILDAALACFAEVGLEATTIEMVRARSGASVGSLYHHFGSKEGIVAALYFEALGEQTEAIQAQIEAAGANVREGVRGIVLGYVDWVEAHPQRARFLFQSRAFVAKGPQAEGLVERAVGRYQALLAWFEPHRQAGVLQDIPCEIYPSLVIGPAQSYCRAWLSGATSRQPSLYREVLADAAWRSVAATPATTPTATP